MSIKMAYFHRTFSSDISSDISSDKEELRKNLLEVSSIIEIYEIALMIAQEIACTERTISLLDHMKYKKWRAVLRRGALQYAPTG